MKTITAGMATHLAGEVTTLARCLRFVLRNDGDRVLTFTDHDQDLVVSGETYEALYGFNASDVASGSDLNADNLEVIGAITTPTITEEDLLAGKWDYAEFRLFGVNWQALVTDGTFHIRSGKLGEVKLDRAKFIAELRGLMQHYETSLGRIEKPACDANLGDARCKFSLGQLDSNGDAPFMPSGVVDSVSADGLTIYVSDRDEDGPTDTRNVSGVTNADPGVVSYATAFDPPLVEGESIVLSGIVGPALLNTITIVRNPGATSFELGIDTSDTAAYPAYVSGGTVSRLGDSGFFDFGIITMTGTSSLNSGISRDIKVYVPGQFVLHEPFPHPVMAGDTYTVTAGCDKTFPTCRDRFNNVVNFRGFPYVLGTDKIIQVGRHNS